MMCAQEILEAKKIIDLERAERERQEAAAKALALAKRREEAKADTFKYAEGLVNSLLSCAKNGQTMKIVSYYESDGNGLHQVMRQDDYRYSNGIRRWECDYTVPQLNLSYLVELLTSLCYDVKRSIELLPVNSCRKERFTSITVSVPSSLPCNSMVKGE